MNNDFHEQPFDDGTKLKLAIFRGYIREWLGLFMTNAPTLTWVKSINIYDLFCGPGYDSMGHSGSPVIMLEEIQGYCQAHPDLKSEIPIRMHFNDQDHKKVAVLKTTLESIRCPNQKRCCQLQIESQPFGEILHDVMQTSRQPSSANLIILDPCGADVGLDVLRQFANCSSTDLLVFIPSAYIFRFQRDPVFQARYELEGVRLEYRTAHRQLSHHLQSKLDLPDYYLAPFSIKKSHNIHGVIFGTGNLRGLEKFLKVCWKLDPKTGEANYNMENEVGYETDGLLFSEVPGKLDVFRRDFVNFMLQGRHTNHDVRQFVLLHGFLPLHVDSWLKEMQENTQLRLEFEDGKSPRKGDYYLPCNARKTVIFIPGKDHP